MSKYRNRLPQLGERLFLSDGGLETTLVFHEKVTLPLFASFPLLETDGGRGLLWRYYERYIDIAKGHGVGFVLEAPTWRANPDWGAQLGYGPEALRTVNRRAIDLMLALRRAHETRDCPMPISGNIGPRGDGYRVEQRMSAEEAAAYHGPQVREFAASAADFISAFTLNYVEEAVGIVRAAAAAGIPVVASFTVETDGRLPDGTTLEQAVTATDEATGSAAAYYMVNCAHPSHFDGSLRTGAWRARIRGVRANASRRSHAELDEAPDLDAGDPEAFGDEHAQLQRYLPGLRVLGGCCGTDHRHVEAIATACLGAPEPA